MSDTKTNVSFYQLVDDNQLEGAFASAFMTPGEEDPLEEAMPSASPVDSSSNAAVSSSATRKGRRRADSSDFEEKWSNQVKEKQKRSKRTGQACDRCKMRKLCCDPNAEGCLNCSAANQRCMVTDRTTGETLERGQGPRLKAENDRLEELVMVLEDENARLLGENAQLRANLDMCIAHINALRGGYEGNSAGQYPFPPTDMQ